MKINARMVKLGKLVEAEMDAAPIGDPIAAGAAVASIYAQGLCTPAEAIDYIGLLATASSRVVEETERDVLVCQISASCGSTLRMTGIELGESIARTFLDPARQDERYSA